MAAVPMPPLEAALRERVARVHPNSSLLGWVSRALMLVQFRCSLAALNRYLAVYSQPCAESFTSDRHRQLGTRLPCAFRCSDVLFKTFRATSIARRTANEGGASHAVARQSDSSIQDAWRGLGGLLLSTAACPLSFGTANPPGTVVKPVKPNNAVEAAA